jgi:parvulin-like peptidyl-prolyl isomerase
MKTCVLSLFLAAALCAQTQTAPTGELKADTVIAKMPDGTAITAADLNRIMRTWPPEITQKFQQDPREALRAIYTVEYLAAQADKKKLGEEAPWKDQIVTAREQILATAMATYENNTFNVSEQDIKTYYERNKSRFEQAKIKVIMLSFLEPMPTGITHDEVQKAGEIVMRNAHVKHPRSLADANSLAANIVKQLRAGADFAGLVAKYSDDDSKSSGGDYGVITLSSSYPDAMKKAVFALQPGEVTDPIRAPNALYIVRLDERSAPPVAQLNEQIVAAIRSEHLKVFAEELGKRFTPSLLHPEFFLPTGQPQPKKP